MVDQNHTCIQLDKTSKSDLRRNQKSDLRGDMRISCAFISFINCNTNYKVVFSCILYLYIVGEKEQNIH